jgi:hypothetical protein
MTSAKQNPETRNTKKGQSTEPIVYRNEFMALWQS